MLPSNFDIFVHLRQKVRLKPELSPKLLSTLDPNPTRNARPNLQLCSALIRKNEESLLYLVPNELKANCITFMTQVFFKLHSLMHFTQHLKASFVQQSRLIAGRKWSLQMRDHVLAFIWAIWRMKIRPIKSQFDEELWFLRLTLVC